MRCAIYTRVSTQEQGREGASLPVQVQACRQFAAQQGWTIVDELQDVHSGLETIKRTAYQQVLELGRAQVIDTVLLWRLDRFGRDDGEAIIRLREMARLQVKVVSATEGEQSPFLQKLMFLLANEESRRTSDRVLPAMRSRVEQGLWQARPPFGYRMVPGRPGHMVVHEEEAAVVRELFRRYLGGASAYTLAEWLNAVTLPPDSNVRAKPNTYSCVTTVRSIMTNPVYIGMVRWSVRRNSKLDGTFKKAEADRVLVPGAHEAIVDREIYDQVQAMFAQNIYRNQGSKVAGTFLLTGLLRCGLCGHRVWGQYHMLSGPKARKTFSYKCGVRGHVCRGGTMVNRYVRAQLARLPVGDDALRAMRKMLDQERSQQPNRTAELRAALARHEERRKRLTLFLADGTLTPTDYRIAIGDVEQATLTVQRELAAMEPTQDMAALFARAETWLRSVTNVGEVMMAATISEERAIISGAVQHVTLFRDRDPVITWQLWAATVL